MTEKLIASINTIIERAYNTRDPDTMDVECPIGLLREAAAALIRMSTPIGGLETTEEERRAQIKTAHGNVATFNERAARDIARLQAEVAALKERYSKDTDALRTIIGENAQRYSAEEAETSRLRKAVEDRNALLNRAFAWTAAARGGIKTDPDPEFSLSNLLKFEAELRAALQP